MQCLSACCKISVHLPKSRDAEGTMQPGGMSVLIPLRRRGPPHGAAPGRPHTLLCGLWCWGDLLRMLWQRQMLSDPDNFTSLNPEESACLPRLRSGRNPAPKQCKSKQILCLQEAELWKFQPFNSHWCVCWQQVRSSWARHCPGTADRVHWTGNLNLCNSFWTLYLLSKSFILTSALMWHSFNPSLLLKNSHLKQNLSLGGVSGNFVADFGHFSAFCVPTRALSERRGELPCVSGPKWSQGAGRRKSGCPAVHWAASDEGLLPSPG